MRFTLPGFTIHDLLQAGTKTLIYRGVRDADGCAVVVKGLRPELCTPHNIEQLQHEYAIAQQLNLPGTVQALDLQFDRGLPYLILQDFGGQSLDQVMDQLRSPGAFLPIALQIVEALCQIHQQRVVHKDIKPQNIIVNLATHQTKIGDFGLAAFIPYTGQLLNSTNRIEGSLPYLAPEQTGRMNRGIDYRSDLYALGATFYEILTGQLPFEGKDPLEWIHCHIAKTPTPPTQINPAIPQVLSDLIMKLLAKVAEDRYQSTTGLQADLQLCWHQWSTQGQITPFAIARQDMSDRLQIPQKLYGREFQIQRLLGVFERVALTGRPELVLVSGYSGVGKSSLVNELQKPIVRTRGLFISGKFDQYKRNIPYATIAQAFQDLVRQLLTEPPEILADWRDRIQAAVGSSGQLITDIIPEVELIIGTPPEMSALGAMERQNRFNLVFQNLIGVFAQPDHPLVIFLDDLQWADLATLELIQTIVTGVHLQSLCFLLAYRDNEVDAFHPFSQMLERLRQQAVQPTEIRLSALNLDCINQLLSETLHCHPQHSLALAQLVLRKTNGNPFFVNEFLKTLAQENLLSFNPAERAWQWNLSQIEAQEITDNVVNLMIGRLQKLSIAAQQALQLASCVGNQFELETLAIVAEQPTDQLVSPLREAVLGGLLKLEQGAAPENHYVFVHDRVQQAAYVLTPETERQALHLRIGRLLLQNLRADQLEDQLFDLVNHLNLGRSLMTELAEIAQLRQLNLRAGQRAKASTAYAPALRFLEIGWQLCGADSWDTHYAEVFVLLTELAECAFLVGQLEQAETLFSLLLNKAQTAMDQARIYLLQIRLYQVAGHMDQAFQMGLAALKLFDVTFPTTSETVQAAIALERQQTLVYLGDRQIADLIDAPVIQDPTQQMIICLLTTMGPPAYLSQPSLFPLVVLRALNYSLRYGNTPESCFAYSMYAMLLVSVFQDIPSGYAFSEMTIRLNQQLADLQYRGTVLHIHGSHINVWCNPMATDLPFLEQGFLGCVEAGDVTMANYNGFQAAWQMIEVMTPLPEAERALQKYLAFAQQTRYAAVYQTIYLQQQFVRNLQGQTGNDQTLSDQEFDEAQALAVLEQANFTSGIVFYRVIKLILGFTYGQFAAALMAAEAAQPVMDAVRSLPIEANFILYHALVLAALYPEQTPEEQAKSLTTLQAHQRQLQYWATHCPANFLHKALLVAAEIARLQSDDLGAMHHYEAAIKSAQEQGFVQYEALANELAAKFYLNRGFEAIARTYFQEARNAYRRWGASSKVCQLESHYPALLPPPQSVAPRSSHASSSSTTFVSSGVQLDVLSVIKASQTISSEIVLSDLLKTLMQIVIEQVGAEVGFMLLVHDDQLVIEVEARANATACPVCTLVEAAETADLVPQSLLNYVQRTQELVILDNATTADLFANDPYIQRHQPRSVFCMPVARQGKLLGILYLENNLATAAFSQTQLSALEILSAQIAISLENAQLYQQLTASQAQLNLALQSGQIGIWSWDIVSDRVIWDDQMYQIFGVDQETFVSTLAAVQQCIHPEDRDSFAQHLRQTLAEEVEHNLEYRVVYPNGEIHHVAARGRPFFNDSGQPVCLTGIALDITEQKLSEARRLQLIQEQTARAEAESANRLKDEFLAVLSHELRSPLNPILGWARLLRTQKLNPAKTEQALETIERNAKLQSELIEDLLDVSRILQGKLSLNVAPVQLDTVINAALETVRLAAEAKSIALDVDLTVQMGPVMGDANRLQQVVWNLLSNAVKFTPAGGRVAIRLEPGVAAGATPGALAMPSARISVTDTGKGIHPDFLPHVFEYFRQADSATTRTYGGLGLGLAIVHHLVELHGGTVWADSPGEGLGASFTVQLPLSVQATSTPEVLEPGAETNLSGLHILVVDDDTDTREFVAFILESAGATVVTAASAIAALTTFTQAPPDLLLSDIGMPEMDGYTLIRQIRQLPSEQGGERPAIAFTAYAGEMNQQQALAAGFQMHISKPVEPDYLIATINKLMARTS